MGVFINNIEYYLPEKIISNDDLQAKHPEWDLKKVGEKSGVFKRHVSGANETAFDLSVKAIEKLIVADKNVLENIQGIIFCTQSPDYIMPSNAFLIHKHFKCKSNVWAFDYNLACSGYIYGLTICRGMLQTGMAKNILLITADTYSKYINEGDRSTSVLFGDGAAACIVSLDNSNTADIIDVSLASSGMEYDSFYIPSGGCRLPHGEATKIIKKDQSGNENTLEDIHMNGFAVWKFISKTVPEQITQLLNKNNIDINTIDFFGFHQASKLTLDSLFKALKIEETKAYTNLANIGNTVSASIPIALKDAETEGKLKRGDLVLLSGFGVGLSWGSLLMRY